MRLAALAVGSLCWSLSWPAMAAPPPVPHLICEGADPAWRVDLGRDSATLNFGRSVTFEIPHRTAAEGRDWPQALTLIGEADSAILIVDRRPCGALPFAALLLTQRGHSPIALSGCCAPAE